MILVEDGLLGSGESGRTTAHFTYALDDRYEHLEKVLGFELTKKAYQSHKEAIDMAEQIVKDEHIECHFKRISGYLSVHPSDTIETLEKEYDIAQKLGIPLTWLDNTPDIE